MNVRRVAAAAVILASAVVAPAAGVVPAVVVAPAIVVASPVVTTIRVLQLNICHSGMADCYTGDRVVAKAASVISANRPQVVSVNEACSGDVAPLRQAMGAAAALFVPAQNLDGTKFTCRNGQAFGNIVLVAEALAGKGPGASGRYRDQVTSGDEMRVWGCLPGGALTACTTHLTSYRESTAMSQCAELMSHAATFAATAPVIVSGDLNLRYPAVQNCNPTGFHRTGDGDVQHVFATTGVAFLGSTQSSMSGTTDHPAWLLTVSFRRSSA